MRPLLLVLVGWLWLATPPGAALAADDFGQRVSGQHVYDRAGVLGDADRQTLERKAAALESAGASTVVFVQAKSATLDDAKDDARALMDAWDVESSTGAHDGFVMMLDLNPSDMAHGQLGMFAGSTFASAQLPSGELNRIAEQVMKPSLASGNLAGGIGAGLDAVASDVRPAATSGNHASVGGSGTGATQPRAAPGSADAGTSDDTSDQSPLDGFLSSVERLGFRFLSSGWFFVAFFGIAIFNIISGFIRRGRGTGRGSSSSGGWWSGDSSGSSSSGGDSGGASSGGDSGGTSF
jgi:uncharacterized membrane protein YgcG